MDVIILADFLGPLDGTFNSRFLYLADMLARDHTVEIITSDFDHGRKAYFQHEIEKHDYTITMLHEGAYSKNVTLKRFYGHYIWAKSVKRYLKKRKRPDVIYCAVPTLKASYEAAKYCKRNNVRFVIDVQDLWPEAFQMVFNVPVISNVIFAPFKFLADGIYKRADAICAVSDTYCQRAARVNKKVKKTTTVFLGTELATFDRYAAENPILKKKTNEIWLAYCGTLGSSYDLTCLIDALDILKNPQLRLIVMGDGPKKAEFERYAKEKKVNIVFTGRLSYDSMYSLLSACDITVNPIANMAAQSIINKHADYVASGLPVVSTQENEEYRNLVEEYQMGFNCRNNDSDDLADKIKKLVDDDELRVQMGENARRCAEECFDRKVTYKLLESQALTEGGYCGLVKMPREIWLGYAGTLGTSYDLPLVFKAIKKLNNSNLRFIVMGDGPLANDFKKQAKHLNVTFTGRMSYSQMCGAISACDMVVNPIVGKSVSSIINKHADYAASGLPVINTQESPEYRNLVEDYNMGFNCKNGNTEEIAEKIKTLIEDKSLRHEMGRNARRCAVERFDRMTSYCKLKYCIME